MFKTEFNIDGDVLVYLNTFFDLYENRIYVKVYNTRNNQIYKLKDVSGFMPFFYMKQEELDQELLETFLNNNKGKYEIITKELYDGIDNKYVDMYKFQSDVSFNTYKKLKEELDASQYENFVRYYESYTLSHGFVTCALYTFKNGMLYEMPQQLDEKKTKILNNMIKNIKVENTEYIEYLKNYIQLLSQDVPFTRRCAIDIEVKNKPGQFPSMETHDDPIIAVSFYSNDGFKQVVVIADQWKDNILPEYCKLVNTEQELIKNIFEVLNEYPVIITFNGDNFDLAYIHQRSFSFNDIDQDTNPILFPFENVKSTKFTKDPIFLKNSLHLDMFRLFSNVSLYNYGFNHKYSEYKLDTIAKAMLGEGKIEITQDKEHLADLTLDELVRYNLKDSELTLRLTTYSNELVMNLLFTISRITKSSIEDINRYGISRWVRSMLYYEHRKKDILIPNRSDLERKGIASTQAIISGKKFKGGFVMEPIVGSHFKVTVLDFACFDDQTEILTNRGWQTIDTIQEGEKCLSVNLKTGNVENDIIEKVYRYDYNDKLIRIKTPRKLDFLFTPNHRVVYNRKKGGYKSGFRKELEVQELKDIKYYHYALPCFGNWIGKQKQEQIRLGNFVFNTNEFFEFLGRFLGNGYLGNRTISIDDNLKYKDRHQKIKELFQNMGFNSKTIGYEKQNRQGFRTYICNNEFCNEIKVLLNNKTHSLDRDIPKEFLEYNKEHLEYLFKGLMESDGCTHSNGDKTYSSVNKELAESFQILALKCGYNCYIRKNKLVGFSNKIKECYQCILSGFRQKKASLVISKQSKTHVQKEYYKGKVWCASTKNTTLIIRRNGRVIVTGNSLYPSIIKTYNISYETINCNHEDCKEHNKIFETTHWYCTKRQGITSLIIGVIRDLRVEYFKKLSKDKSLSNDELELYDSITQASKVILNGTYGVIGSESFDLFCLPVAESITALGRRIITQTKQYAETQLGCKVLYGDSVLFDTPIVLKHKLTNELKIVSIQSLIPKTHTSLRYSSNDKNYEILSDDGFTIIKHIYKHKIKKRIYKILTRHILIECTEDHSLIINNKEVKPNTLKIGDIIDLIDFKTYSNGYKFNKKLAWLFGLFLAEGTSGVYHYPNKKSKIKYSFRIVCLDKNMLVKAQQILKEELGFNSTIYDIRKSSHVYGLNICDDVKTVIEYFKICYDSSGKKTIPPIILNADLESKQSFIDGFIENDGHTDKFGITTIDQIHKNVISGLCLLLKELGFDYTLQLRNDKFNVVRIRLIKNKQSSKLIDSNIIKKIESYEYEDYVYDIETDNHHFAGGIGNILLHNTDSLFIHNPTEQQTDKLILMAREKFDIDLEVDKKFKFVIFSPRKKNYLGVYENGKVDTKGLTGKKSNVPPYVKSCFNDVINILKVANNKDQLEFKRQEANKCVEKYIANLRNRNYKLEDLLFSIKLKNDINSYGKIKSTNQDFGGNNIEVKSGVPAHIKAAKQIEREGTKIEQNSFIRFIKTKNGVKSLGKCTKNEVKIESYIEQLESTLDPIFDVLDIDFKSLVNPTIKQITFGTMFS